MSTAHTPVEHWTGKAAWEIFREFRDSTERTPICPRIAAIIAKHSPAPALLAALQGYLDRHQNEADGAGSKECECFECRTARAALASATP